MSIITTIVMVFGIFATGAGILELLSGSGPTFLIIGLICLFGPIIFRTVFGKKIDGKHRKEDSKCYHCGRNIGGGKYEYDCDFGKPVTKEYDHILVRVYIKATCPHCGRKKNLSEDIELDTVHDIHAWKLQVKERVKEKMDSLDR